MNLSSIIDDFSLGEVSPLVLAKLASAEVRSGLSENTNMIPDAHGPLVSRQGMKHLWKIPATDLSASVYDFEMYEGKSLCIVLYDDQATIFNISAETVTVDTFTSPYTAVMLHGTDRNQHNVEAVKSPDGTKLYFLHKSVAPWVMEIADLATPSDTDLDATFAAVSFTDMPAEWTGDNYPTTMSFFQNRTWWGGCGENPETFWGSKSYEHHILTIGTAADDACKFTLEKEGLIKWISGHSTLLIGTSWGEFIASGSATVIEPGDIQIEPQSAYGSKRLTPSFLGDEVLYVSPDGRKLRSMWWRWVESGWKSVDLTFTGEHLTSDKIKDIAYARDPDSVIWLLTEAGELILCSYRRKNENKPVVGWGRIELGGTIGAVSGMSVVKDGGTSSLIVAAKVTEDGSEALHLMRMDANDIYDEDLVLLDDYMEFSSPGDTLTGLDHLEGETVAIVADNAVLPDQEVVSGEITLDDDSYTTVYVGHEYTQKVETLPRFIYEKQQAHQMKRWTKIYCYIYNSFIPKINGNRPATRHPATAMGEGEDLYSGMVLVTNKGWDREAKVTVEQDIPRPLVILGIYGDMGIEALG